MSKNDPLRKHLVNLLTKAEAHVDVQNSLSGFPVRLGGRKPPGAPHTPWQLLEHMRIAQWDILQSRPLQRCPNGAALVSQTGPAGVANGSAVSSYAGQSGGALSVISASVPTLGAANCWNALTPDGRFVYVSNSASGSISGFSIAANGTLSPVAGTVLTANPAGTTNLDLAVSSDGKFMTLWHTQQTSRPKK
jgi:hypothetical protein